jgi:hypothetical protein
MKFLIYFLLCLIVSCKAVEYPGISISKKCKRYIYSLTKDTLNKEWLNETKSQNWEVIYIKKYINNNYTIKTRSSNANYKGFFIIVYLDSCLQIKTVGKEIK